MHTSSHSHPPKVTAPAYWFGSKFSMTKTKKPQPSKLIDRSTHMNFYPNNMCFVCWRVDSIRFDSLPLQARFLTRYLDKFKVLLANTPNVFGRAACLSSSTENPIKNAIQKRMRLMKRIWKYRYEKSFHWLAVCYRHGPYTSSVRQHSLSSNASKVNQSDNISEKKRPKYRILYVIQVIISYSSIREVRIERRDAFIVVDFCVQSVAQTICCCYLLFSFALASLTAYCISHCFWNQLKMDRMKRANQDDAMRVTCAFLYRCVVIPLSTWV